MITKLMHKSFAIEALAQPKSAMDALEDSIRDLWGDA